MGKRTVEENNLVAVADAIREKSGGSDPLAFPEGFVTAIEGISSGGGGGDDENFTAFIEGRLTNMVNATASCVGYDLVANPFKSTLKTINLPACTTVSAKAFLNCKSITDVNLPVCKSIFASAFRYCEAIVNVNLPACELIGESAFGSCFALTSINLPACTKISAFAFEYCSSLSRIDLGGSTMCKLDRSVGTFPDQMATTGAFYVPASLVSTYQGNYYWGKFSSRIFAIEDAPTD